MKKILFTALFIAATLSGAGYTLASVSTVPAVNADVVQHGGGCRKSSPPGQCCHMDNSTGTVHCH